MKPRVQAVSRPLVAASLILLLAACAPEESPESTASAPTASSSEAPGNAVAPLSETDAAVVALSDAEVQSAAERVVGQLNLKPAEGLGVKLWAPEKLLADPVAINVDYEGRVWAAITNRSNNSEFDIRGYPHWEFPSIGFETVEDRREFLRQDLAPEKSAQNEWLPDRNEDGSHDWRDLAVVKEEVVLLEDTSGNGQANQSRRFLKDFHSEVTDVLGGIYYHNELDELFLAVAPNAWRVKDTDGDLQADTKTAISEGFGVHIGFSGHGMSGVTLGPDGRIYYGIGDIGGHITDVDGNEYAYPNQGMIVRSEPDGSHFEVFARGVRNTHEFTFDKYGNLITVDNDGDHEGEYERVVYLVDGSDSGWRTNWQLGKYKDPKNNRYKVWMDESYFTPRFEDQAAHLLPPVAPYHAGPTGMVYNPGTALNDKWQDHFFVVEFVGSAARSGINAFTLEPKGAGFEMTTDQNIFRGVQATGLDVGPDGTLYMSDWVSGWGINGKGRIWKLDATEGVDSDLRAETQALLQADFTEKSTAELSEHLSHPDMRVRQRAQLNLAAREDEDALLEVATTSEHQLARIHAIWGLGQLMRADTTRSAVLLPLLEDTDPEIRAQVAKVLGDVAYAEARNDLVPLLSDDSARVRFFATQALGRIGNAEDMAAVVDMLAANADEDVYLRHGGAIALARMGDEAALGELENHASEAVRVAAVVALKRLRSVELTRFLDDGSEYVVTNAARGISDDRFVEDALPALAKLLETTTFTNEPLLRRLINANLYAGGDESVERLLDFAQRADISGTLRAEALDTLATWSASSQFDRVTGRVRGVITHPLAQAAEPLSARAGRLLEDGSPEVRASAVNALAALSIEEATPALVRALSDDASAQVRAAALQALFELEYAQMGRAAMTATNDADSDVRMAALALLPKLSLPTDEVVEMHRLLLVNGSVDEQQAAYRSLANVDDPSAHALLGESLQALREGELAGAVQLDVIEAIKATENQTLLAELEAYEANKNRNQPMEVFREALEGGDPAEGMNLFRYSNQAQCIRCHMIGHRGARVGPELTRIGETLTRAQLLEALVDPGARVPPGHGRVSVTLKDGETISGFFEAETEDSMTIVDGDNTVEVARSNVVKTEYSGSGMPPMGMLLDRGQIRDIVAYLATLPTEEEQEGH
ncbi:HEAT repeat domain-containing protein [Marinimicrobium agarilyticum]|uniref:HEAT repeat domain-containing protein n=1 Tax=Marinimicrobium agarilyticum TaxID=306546 RepID=UPI000685B478|nr:HEAT repeat domain-containing protein [Marinimicrobium agarilyticum]